MNYLGLRTLGAVTTALAAAWTAITIYAVYPASPYSPVQLPHAGVLQNWAPQGWAFFTRDPREERVMVYAHTARGWVSPSRGTNGRPRNAFGFNRASRAEGVELALLLDGLQEVRWAKCRGAPTACLDAIGPRAAIFNRSPRPTFCGTLGIVTQAPPAWAWARSPRPAVVPSLVTRVEVTC